MDLAIPTYSSRRRAPRSRRGIEAGANGMLVSVRVANEVQTSDVSKQSRRDGSIAFTFELCQRRDDDDRVVRAVWWPVAFVAPYNTPGSNDPGGDNNTLYY